MRKVLALFAAAFHAMLPAAYKAARQKEITQPLNIVTGHPIPHSGRSGVPAARRAKRKRRNIEKRQSKRV
jgi:hypothetical protein